MKKLFALLLAFTLLFLTACNNNPADSTTDTGTGTGMVNPQNPVQPSELELKDTIVYNLNRGFIDLPSRVLYEQSGRVYYYSKADGNAYVYCFDPLCEHNDEYCMSNPGIDLNSLYIFFINNRFYYPMSRGQIVSFSFDGTDRKIEYDHENDGSLQQIWGHCMAVGPYIYIEMPSYASEDGIAHTWRFNVETREMEDLTEKTGNYIRPNFFYNGMLYGYGQGIERVKTDIDLTYCEEIETIPSSYHFSGSRFFGISNSQGHSNIRLYDMKTETLETYEIDGLDEGGSISNLYADENYFYFYKNEKILIGEVWSRGELKPAYKYNDGSIYRVNHDGTGLVCIYEAPEDFTITGKELLIVGDQLLIQSQNTRVRDNVSETWNNGLWAGTIGADGKIDELKPVEVVE